MWQVLATAFVLLRWLNAVTGQKCNTINHGDRSLNLLHVYDNLTLVDF